MMLVKLLPEILGRSKTAKTPRRYSRETETERGREQCSTLAAEGVVSLQVVGAIDTRITSTTVDQRPTVTLTADHVTVA